IRSHSTFDDKGKEHGKIINYRSNPVGQMESIKTFEHGELKGEVLHFFKSGNLKSRRQVGIDGKWTAYEYYDFENEPIEKETQMLGTKKHGVYKEYEKDGSIQLESAYTDGKEDGIRKKYWKDGTLFTLETYQNGKKEGR